MTIWLSSYLLEPHVAAWDSLQLQTCFKSATSAKLYRYCKELYYTYVRTSSFYVLHYKLLLQQATARLCKEGCHHPIQSAVTSAGPDQCVSLQRSAQRVGAASLHPAPSRTSQSAPYRSIHMGAALVCSTFGPGRGFHGPCDPCCWIPCLTFGLQGCYVFV